MSKFGTAAAALALAVASIAGAPALADRMASSGHSAGNVRSGQSSSALTGEQVGSGRAWMAPMRSDWRDRRGDRDWRDGRGDRDWHDGRRNRRDHRRSDGWAAWGGGSGVYVNGGYEGGRSDWGFFASGGKVSVINGRARYDYDRGYPYDHYDSGHQDETHGSGRLAEEDFSCSLQWVRDARGSGRSQVRICRR